MTLLLTYSNKEVKVHAVTCTRTGDAAHWVQATFDEVVAFYASSKRYVVAAQCCRPDGGVRRHG